MYADLTLTGAPSLDSCISSDLKEWGERFVINYMSHTDHFEANFARQLFAVLRDFSPC